MTLIEELDARFGFGWRIIPIVLLVFCFITILFLSLSSADSDGENAAGTTPPKPLYQIGNETGSDKIVAGMLSTVNHMHFFQHTETGLCFAYNYRRLATVDCETVANHLIKELPTQ